MISIVIATFNSERTLQRCLNSIYNQKYHHYEILIKDGDSTDGTIAIIKDNSPKISYWNSSPDQGVYDAWNHCLKFISGDWFIFLGSDDYFIDSDFLNKASCILDSADITANYLVYGMNLIIDQHGNHHSVVGSPWELARNKIYSQMTIRHPGCFHSRKLLNLVGHFDERFRIAGDHHYILKCLIHSEPIFYPFVGVVHENGGLSTNPKHCLLLIKETFLIQKDLKLSTVLNLDRVFIKRIMLYTIYLMFGEKFARILLDFKSNFRRSR